MSKKAFALFALVAMVAFAGVATAETPASDQDLAAVLSLSQGSCDAPAAAPETAEVDLENDLLAPMAGQPCNEVSCNPNEFCCNFSCSICAPKPDGVCTQQICDDGSSS